MLGFENNRVDGRAESAMTEIGASYKTNIMDANVAFLM